MLLPRGTAAASRLLRRTQPAAAGAALFRHRWLNDNVSLCSRPKENLLNGCQWNFSSASEPQPHKHVIALILGKPGGGKGTISGKILADFPVFHHFSTGDVLRQHVRNQTDLGKEAQKHMDEGSLVPDDLMIRLVLEEEHEDESHGGSGSLLLDGFPRTIEQAVALDDALNVDLVINLDIPTETIVERIADRWIHPASGRIYSYSYKPPKTVGLDDDTGEPLVQRDDDKPERVRKRLEAYDAVTAPLIEYYDGKGVLKNFHGTKSDVIYVSVKKWLSEEIPKLM